MMTLSIGNGAVLRSSSQWQLKEFDGIDGIYLYFVNNTFLVDRYWDFKFGPV